MPTTSRSGAASTSPSCARRGRTTPGRPPTGPPDRTRSRLSRARRARSRTRSRSTYRWHTPPYQAAAAARRGRFSRRRERPGGRLREGRVDQLAPVPVDLGRLLPGSLDQAVVVGLRELRIGPRQLLERPPERVLALDPQLERLQLEHPGEGGRLVAQLVQLEAADLLRDGAGGVLQPVLGDAQPHHEPEQLGPVLLDLVPQPAEERCQLAAVDLGPAVR